jgi:hypothetical protein
MVDGTSVRAEWSDGRVDQLRLDVAT